MGSQKQGLTRLKAKITGVGLRVCNYRTVVNPGYGHNPLLTPTARSPFLGLFGDLPEFLGWFVLICAFLMSILGSL